MKELKNSLKFIKETKNYIYFSFLAFFLFFFLGIIFPFFKNEILSLINELKTIFEGKNFFETFGLIFFNNARAALTSIIFGIFFGFFPIILIISNGYIVGVVTKIVIEKVSIFEIWRLLPHGIFELPAIFISAGIGIKIGFGFLKNLSFKKSMEELEKALKTFIIIIIPLLIVAAFIETVLIFLF